MAAHQVQQQQVKMPNFNFLLLYTGFMVCDIIINGKLSSN